jgi:NTE family protein
MHRRFTVILCLLISIASAAYPQSKPQGRKSVALVLAGGGAYGFALVPLLQMLEEIGMPIDMILGTSSGSIIGGLYAAGYSAAELRDLLLAADIPAMFHDLPMTPLEQDLGAHSKYAYPLAVSFNSSPGLELGRGISTGQHIYDFLKEMTVRIPSYTDFDSLPIPFRAVTVELMSGDVSVLEKGDIAEAIRASIAVPGVFEPFIIDGKYCIDGTIQVNMPIQIAKDLGFDIIIAIDISPRPLELPEELDHTPIHPVAQMLIVKQRLENIVQYPAADIVIDPDLQQYTILDYNRPEDIYETGKTEFEKFRSILVQLKSDICGETTAGIDTGPATSRVYTALPYQVTDSLVTSGELETDRIYIERKFRETIHGTLTETALNDFISSIYETGHYTLVTARTDTRDGKGLLELTLTPAPEENLVVMFGGGYSGTLAPDCSNNLTFSSALQLRGLTTPESVLSFASSFIDSLDFQLLFFQPLGRNIFLKTSGTLVSKPIINTIFFDRPMLTGNYEIYSLKAELGAGVRFDREMSLEIAGSFNYFNISDTEIHENIEMDASFSVQHTNYPFLPTSGFSLSLFSATILPTAFLQSPQEAFSPFLPDGPSSVFSIAELEFHAAIPFAQQAAFHVAGTAAADICSTDTGSTVIMPAYGLFSGDRFFFPDRAAHSETGTFKANAALIVQYEPYRNLTPAGGQLIFLTGGTVGTLRPTWQNFISDPAASINWNSYIGIAVRSRKFWNIMLRCGAGTTDTGTAPFLAIDIITMKY